MTLAVILPEPLMLTSNIAPLPPPLTVVAEMFEKLVEKSSASLVLVPEVSLNCICPTVTVYFAAVPPAAAGAEAATLVKVRPIIDVLDVVDDVGVVVIAPTVTLNSAAAPDPPVPATFVKVRPIIAALSVV